MGDEARAPLESAAPQTGFIYPDYTLGEQIADGIIHICGISLALTALTWVLVHGQAIHNPALYAATLIYVSSALFLFLTSAAYHMTPWTEHRPTLRIFDQAAIFGKIAGTYTPIVVLLDTMLSYGLLTLIYGVSLAGAVGKFVRREMLDRHTVRLYLLLGWASIALLWSLFQHLAFFNAALIVAGGLLYTIGVIFHQWDDLKFQNAIWHAFVLAASGCHFFAISGAVFAAQ